MILPVLAVLFFLLTRLASRFPEVTEKWYAQNFYPRIAGFLSGISSLVPFSLDDLFYLVLLVMFVLLLVFIVIRKIAVKRAGIIVLNVLSAVFILFYFLWGFNYFRNNLNERLGISEAETDEKEFATRFRELIDVANGSYSTFEEFDKARVDSLVEDSYRKLSPALKINYPAGKRSAKPVTFSRFFAKAGISGYYGPFFNEIHVNRFILPQEYPFVLAHEKAHQLGITSEAEASFYAWLVCFASNSKQLRYSASLAILRYFIYQGTALDNFREIVGALDDNVRKDFLKIGENWSRLRNDKVDKVASKVNDVYLKSNKVKKGIDDYHGVVKYVIDFSQDSLFREKWNLNGL